jgi:hypothetical protein
MTRRLLGRSAGRAFGQPGVELHQIARSVAAPVGVPVRFVGTFGSAPPVAAHIDCHIAGSAAPDAALQIDRNDRRRVLLDGIVANRQLGQSWRLWQGAAQAQSIRTANQSVAHNRSLQQTVGFQGEVRTILPDQQIALDIENDRIIGVEIGDPDIGRSESHTVAADTIADQRCRAAALIHDFDGSAIGQIIAGYLAVTQFEASARHSHVTAIIDDAARTDRQPAAV